MYSRTSIIQSMGETITNSPDNRGVWINEGVTEIVSTKVRVCETSLYNAERWLIMGGIIEIPLCQILLKSFSE